MFAMQSTDWQSNSKSSPRYLFFSLSSSLIFLVIFIAFGTLDTVEAKASSPKSSQLSRDREPPTNRGTGDKLAISVMEGEENVMLHCPVPKPKPISTMDRSYVKYMWALDGKQLENTTRRHQSQSNLFISPVLRERDTGNFTCTASNSITGLTVVSDPQVINFIWISPYTSVHRTSPEKEADLQPGVEVILKCQVDGTTHITFQWFRNGELLLSDGKVLDGKLLHLKNVLADENGSYTCTASNDAGVADSDGSFHLIVEDEDAPRLITGPENVVARRDSLIHFHCAFDLAKNTTVQWRQWDVFGDRLIHNSSRHTVYPNGTLQIDKIEMSDTGMYKCLGSIAAFPSNTQMYTAQLKIAFLEEMTISALDAPQQLRPDGKLGVREKSRLEIDCREPSGYPIPLIYWEDPHGKRLKSKSEGKREGNVFTQDSSTLIIENIQRDQAGKYSCIAENLGGSSGIIVEVIITTQPSIQTPPKSAIVDEGESAVFTCLFKTGDLSKVRWLRNGLVIPSKNEPDDSGNIQRGLQNSTVVIKPVGLTDAGDYTCEIITPGFPPVHSRPAQLFVTEKLKFQPKPIDRKLELGSNSKIHCKAHGNPTPIVRWLKPKEDEPLFQLPGHLIDVNGTLHFPTVVQSDAGMYICVASNSQGVINSSIKVEVIVPPKFVVSPRNPTDAIEGQPVMIDCQAQGDPKPTIKWDKENNLHGIDYKRFHVLENGSLVVSKVTRDDHGLYGCTAGNSGGFKREEVRLVVKSNDQFISESIEEGNLMTRTVSITLSVATGYMLLVIGLMLWCRYRQLQRKHAYIAESHKENGDAEMKETGPLANGNGSNGPLLQNGRAKKPSSGDSVKSEGETAKSTHSSVGNGRAASVTASVASHRSQASQHSKRSCGSGYDRISYPRQHLQFVMLLGHGEFGEVFLAKAKRLKDNEAETLVMVKSLQTRDETALFNFKREIDMYYKLNHDNINPLVKLCRDMDPHFMIMEYSDWGDLKQFLLATRQQSIRKVPKPPTLTMSQIIQVVSQVALGMEHLSNNRFVHKDLATRNCLISSGLRIKISNPNLSKDTYSSEYYNYRNQIIPLRWLPPEALFDDDYSTKSDVWAFAVLIWEVINQAQIPFEQQSSQVIVERLERKESIWNACDMTELIPSKLVELLNKCWDTCPTNRPSFSTVAIQLDEILREIK